MFGQARLKTMMMQSRVDFPLFVLILSLMTASCFAMDNKTPDTKVTAPTHFLRLFKISRLQKRKVYVARFHVQSQRQ